jgi:hypothetical protein
MRFSVKAQIKGNAAEENQDVYKLPFFRIYTLGHRFFWDAGKQSADCHHLQRIRRNITPTV